MQALGGASDGQAALVALFSVASAAGRLVAGHLPERELHARRTPRLGPNPVSIRWSADWGTSILTHVPVERQPHALTLACGR